MVPSRPSLLSSWLQEWDEGGVGSRDDGVAALVVGAAVLRGELATQVLAGCYGCVGGAVARVRRSVVLARRRGLVMSVIYLFKVLS